MFNADEQKKLAQWFKQIADHTKKCQACGRFDEAFTHPELVCAPFAPPGQSKNLDRALHLLARECRACGHVMFFNAEKIGIHGRH